MAEYPGLPNWGYGAHIPIETVLGLIPGTPQQKLNQSEVDYRKGVVGAVKGRNVNEGTDIQLRHRQAMLEDLMGLESQRAYGLTPTQEAMVQYLRDQLDLGPVGLPPAPNAPRLNPAALNKAVEGTKRENIIKNYFDRMFGGMLAKAMTPKGKSQTPPAAPNVPTGSPTSSRVPNPDLTPEFWPWMKYNFNLPEIPGAVEKGIGGLLNTPEVAPGPVGPQSSYAVGKLGMPSEGPLKSPPPANTLPATTQLPWYYRLLAP